MTIPTGMAAQLKTLQEIVGGYIEAIGPQSGDCPWVAYINEDGKDMGLARNPAAQILATMLGWHPWNGDYLVGPAVFLGHDGPDETDVPLAVLERARVLGLV